MNKRLKKLSKEDIKKIILWLEDYYYVCSYKHQDYPENIDDLPTITDKLKTYDKKEKNK